jgi:ribonuclease HI
VEKVWFWKACQDILPTRDNLFRRKVVDDPNCPICGREMETIYHTLWQCPSAQDIWSGSCSKIQKSSFHNSDFLRVAEELWGKCDIEEFQLFVVTARRLWLRRNDVIYKNSFTHPDTIVLKAKIALEEFQKVQAKTEASQDNGLEGRTVPGIWKAPRQGWYKVNWDAAVTKKSERIGLGAVIRDHTGEVQAVKSLTHTSLVESVVAEAMTARMAIQLARELGLEQIQMEGDAKVVVEAVKSNAPDWSCWGHVTKDIRIALQYFKGWDMSFVSRTSNHAAHTIARSASTQVLDKVWTREVPECIRAIIALEKTALIA